MHCHPPQSRQPPLESPGSSLTPIIVLIHWAFPVTIPMPVSVRTPLLLTKLPHRLLISQASLLPLLQLRATLLTEITRKLTNRLLAVPKVVGNDVMPALVRRLAVLDRLTQACKFGFGLGPEARRRHASSSTGVRTLLVHLPPRVGVDAEEHAVALLARIEDDAGGGFAVAAGAARFLCEGL